MFSTVENCTEATGFSAIHVNEPTCSSRTDSMLKLLKRLLIKLTDSPLKLLFNDRLFNIQVIVIGRSPFETRHCVEITSPALMESSPNENGVICGFTIKLIKNTTFSYCCKGKKVSFFLFVRLYY